MSQAAAPSPSPPPPTPVAVPAPPVSAVPPTSGYTKSDYVDNRNMVRAAAAGNRDALNAMIRSFIPDDEQVIASAFLGKYGSILKHQAFFAVTDRRAISILVGPFRRISYTDALLEHINSSGIEQPSRGPLYFRIFFTAAITLGIGLIFAPWISRRWYKKNKDGLFLNVQDAFPVVTFVDAATLPTAIALYRDFSLARDDRLAQLALSAA